MSESIALLTNKTFLMHKNGEIWSKLVDITKYPQIGSEPEQIEVTRLTDTKKRYIEGLQDASTLAFEANYTKEDYDALIALKGSLETFCLCFGDQRGTDGRWEWSGKVSVFISEGESNAARKMTINISDEGDEPITEADPLTESNIDSE